jgi:cardiolipin synthase
MLHVAIRSVPLRAMLSTFRGFRTFPDFLRRQLPSAARSVPVALVVGLLILPGCASKRPFDAPLESKTAVGSPGFRQQIGSLLGAPATGGNRIGTLVNGDEIFPAMLRAIRGAKRTVTFETYVFEKGEIPRQFAEAFSERARAGVKVHLTLDGHGAKKSKAYHREMEEAGVQIARFHTVFYPDFRRYNNRTHRKILVVDGKVGFIGGVGIADQWAGNADAPKHWRDTHYRVEGPVVGQLQGAFAVNWLRTRKELLHGPEYFPALGRAGDTIGSVFHSSPRHGKLSVPILYHVVIASTRRSLKIENAYFVPDDGMVAALTGAARRGVKVQIIVPGRQIDQKAVRRASRKRWEELLKGGVEIYEYQPTMIHSKLLIADGLFVSIGSANFDNRSLSLNDEANLNVLDAGFAREQTRLFDRDLARSIRVTLENMNDKGLGETPVDAVRAPVEAPLESQL